MKILNYSFKGVVKTPLIFYIRLAQFSTNFVFSKWLNQDIIYFHKFQHYSLNAIDYILNPLSDECQKDPATKIDRTNITFDPNYAAHALCVCSKAKLQDEEGNVDREELMKLLSIITYDEDFLREAVKKCGVNKETPEKTGLHIYECSREFEILVSITIFGNFFNVLTYYKGILL